MRTVRLVGEDASGAQRSLRPTMEHLQSVGVRSGAAAASLPAVIMGRWPQDMAAHVSGDPDPAGIGQAGGDDALCAVDAQAAVGQRVELIGQHLRAAQGHVHLGEVLIVRVHRVCSGVEGRQIPADTGQQIPVRGRGRGAGHAVAAVVSSVVSWVVSWRSSTAVDIQPPSKVSHIRAVWPDPCRVTIRVARFRSGSRTHSVLRNVSVQFPFPILPPLAHDRCSPALAVQVRNGENIAVIDVRKRNPKGGDGRKIISGGRGWPPGDHRSPDDDPGGLR